ncbi:hypothetical protein PAF17_02010 [Paracoccus sp. Z330]|uniref:Methyl-accepting chemotaxis protein n=1 Tax=Paracoccus onchidii TaxID=3017813 RepID=A0ABT4ZAJ1_9RHOB|nr:hypothetical protein [Paracoccus onchidii]MDB6176277.1 hypothetical protein [Paracoccus onchidii]
MFLVRLGKAIRNLALALINATLILLAICLWFGWKLMAEVNGVTQNMASNLVSAQPALDRIDTLRAEIVGLRTDLADLRETGSDTADAAVAKLQDRAAGLEARLAEFQNMSQYLADDPGIILDRAVSTAVTQLAHEAQGMLQCKIAPTAAD